VKEVQYDLLPYILSSDKFYMNFRCSNEIKFHISSNFCRLQLKELILIYKCNLNGKLLENCGDVSLFCNEDVGFNQSVVMYISFFTT
jgi:hypothetical protein